MAELTQRHMAELADLFIAYQTVPPGRAASGPASSRRTFALALDTAAHAAAHPCEELSADGWARLLDECKLRSRYLAPTATSRAGEAALDFPSFVAAVARLAFAQHNPRHEASGLYTLPPWPDMRTRGGQRAEGRAPLPGSQLVQQLVQLPEAFHLLMRHALGPAAARLAPADGRIDTEPLFTAGPSSAAVDGALDAADVGRMPHETRAELALWRRVWAGVRAACLPTALLADAEGGTRAVREVLHEYAHRLRAVHAAYASVARVGGGGGGGGGVRGGAWRQLLRDAQLLTEEGAEDGGGGGGGGGDGGSDGERGIPQVDVAAAEQIIRQLSGAPPAGCVASMKTKPRPGAGAMTARATPQGNVNAVSSPDERPSPSLALPAFFEALVWLAWRCGGATRQRGDVLKAAKELAPLLRRLLATALLPRARADPRVAPLHQLTGEAEVVAMLEARHGALRRLADSHARGVFAKRLGAAAARAALAPLVVPPLVLSGTSEVTGDVTGERYAVGLSSLEIDAAFAAVAAARGLGDDAAGVGVGIADGDGDGGDDTGGGGGGGGGERGVWAVWGCLELPGSQAGEAMGQVAALCGHVLFGRVPPMGVGASVAAALRILLDGSSAAAEVARYTCVRLQQPRFRVPPAPPSAAAAVAAVAAAASLGGAEDVPLAAAHGAWAGVWERLDLAPVIGFPIWEAEVHAMLAERALPLLDLFAHYCGRGDDAAARERGVIRHRAAAAGAGAPAGAPPRTSPLRAGSPSGRYNPLFHHKGQPAAPEGFWGLQKASRGTHPATDHLPPRAGEEEMEGLLARRATDASAAGNSAPGAEAGTAAPPFAALSLTDFSRLLRACGAGAALPAGAAADAFARFAEAVAGSAAASGGEILLFPAFVSALVLLSVDAAPAFLSSSGSAGTAAAATGTAAAGGSATRLTVPPLVPPAPSKATPASASVPSAAAAAAAAARTLRCSMPGCAARFLDALLASVAAARARGGGTRARCAAPDTRAVLAAHGKLARFALAAAAADGGAALLALLRAGGLLGAHEVQRTSPITADAAALQVFVLSLSPAAARAALARAAPPRLDAAAALRPARPAEVLVRLAELLYAPLLAAEDDLPRVSWEAVVREAASNLAGEHSVAHSVRALTSVAPPPRVALAAMARPAAMSERSWHLWAVTWRDLGPSLRPLPYFPLWEVALYEVLLAHLDELVAIFRHYAAGPPDTAPASANADAPPLDVDDIRLSKEEWGGLLTDCGILSGKMRGRDAISAKIGAEARRAFAAYGADEGGAEITSNP